MPACGLVSKSVVVEEGRVDTEAKWRNFWLTLTLGLSRGKERDAFQTLAKALARMDEQDRKLLVSMAEGMARRGARGRRENKSSF
jgi:hypothetical protein